MSSPQQTASENPHFSCQVISFAYLGNLWWQLNKKRSKILQSFLFTVSERQKQLAFHHPPAKGSLKSSLFDICTKKSFFKNCHIFWVMKENKKKLMKLLWVSSGFWKIWKGWICTNVLRWLHFIDRESIAAFSLIVSIIKSLGKIPKQKDWSWADNGLLIVDVWNVRA